MGRTDAVAFTQQWAARARELGATVDFEAGWDTRGNGSAANYEGGIVHHTASASSQAKPFPTRTVLINGRTDLAGPLCNVAAPWSTESAPRLVVVSARPANHAGASGGKSMGPLPVTGSFNARVFGLEIDYAGTSPMTPGQYRAALIFARAVADVLGRSTEYVRAHAETSVTGKWDPGYASGKTYDMAAFRRDAAALTVPTEEDMLSALTPDEQRRVLAAADLLNYLLPQLKDIVVGHDQRQEGYGRRIENTEAQVTAVNASQQAVAEALRDGSGLDAAQAVAAGQAGAEAALVKLGKELTGE